jgi:galactonate dehydratase
LPVYRLFGGPVRTTIPLYANINRATVERTPEAFALNAAQAVAEGFRAVKCAPFDGMDQRRVRDRGQRLRIAGGLACLEAVREAVGPDVDVLVDCHSHFDVPTALEVAGELRRLGITWFEEPLPSSDRDGLARVRAAVPDLELIGGETLFGLAGFWPFVAAGIWDVIMPDVKHCGGISALIDIARLAESRGVAVSPHNPSGPVAAMASAHAAAAMPQIRALEHAWGEVPWRGDVTVPAERIVDGQYVLPTAPGLGITLDDVTIAAHQELGHGF